MEQEIAQSQSEKRIASPSSKSSSASSTQTMRQIAYPISIAHMLNAKFEQRQGWDPSVIHVDGVAIARVNIFGVLVSFSQGSYLQAVLDDGTGQITLRAFEPLFVPDSVMVGSLVLVIGRPRKYNEQLFLVPEIIRPLTEKKFIDIRRAEIEKRWKPIEKKESSVSVHNSHNDQYVDSSKEKQESTYFAIPANESKHQSLPSNTSVNIEPQTDSAQKINVSSTNSHLSSTQIIEYIDVQDKGPGVALDDIRKAFVGSETEKHILQLMLGGEIFEIRPGRVKVLK